MLAIKEYIKLRKCIHKYIKDRDEYTYHWAISYFHENGDIVIMYIQNECSCGDIGYCDVDDFMEEYTYNLKDILKMEM